MNQKTYRIKEEFTTDQTNILYNKLTKQYFYLPLDIFVDLNVDDNDFYTYCNIYICSTSFNDIEHGDYFFYGGDLLYFSIGVIGNNQKSNFINDNDLWEDCKKIVSSTDLSINLPKLPESFIREYVDRANKLVPICYVEVDHQINQCDGCQKGLELVDGIHLDKQIFGIACTKDLYDKPKINSANEITLKELMYTYDK